MLSQITSHGLALTDPAVWEGPAAVDFSGQVWPGRPVNAGHRARHPDGAAAAGRRRPGNVTNAGSGLPVVGQLPAVGGLVGGLTNGL